MENNFVEIRLTSDHADFLVFVMGVATGYCLRAGENYNPELARRIIGLFNTINQNTKPEEPK